MNSVISDWKKAKQSGHFKRSVKKRYNRILSQNCSSRDQPLVEVANNEEANLEDTPILASGRRVNTEEQYEGNKDQHDMTNERVEINSSHEVTADTEDENLIHSLSEIEKKIIIKELLKIWEYLST